MSDEIDLNVDNYDIDELVQLLKFENNPINEDMIVDKINKLKKRYKNNSKYVEFFTNAGKRLILNFEKLNNETWQDSYTLDESLSSKVLAEQYIDNKNNNKNLIIDEDRNIIGVKKISDTKSLAKKETTQGIKNPIEITKIRRIVNFDSQYREILNPISDNCFIDETNQVYSINNINSEKRLFHPTNYTVNLNQPLVNVVDISLESIEIPNTWYVFSEDYGTNALEFEYYDQPYKRDLNIDIDRSKDYTLIIEIKESAVLPKTRDTTIGIRHASTKQWIVTDDDGGDGKLSKIEVSLNTFLDKEIYELWVGEYKLYFLDGNDPLVRRKNETNTNHIIEITVKDSDDNILNGYPQQINNIISENGVDLTQQIIINGIKQPEIKKTKKKVLITNGNYTPQLLIDELNQRCQNIPVEFFYNTINGKVTIINTNPTNNLLVRFYIEDAESSGCSAQKIVLDEGTRTPVPGNKIDYNLGILLGFRQRFVNIPKNSYVEATGLIDTFGPKYFLLTLDDFNNNKPNKDLISLVDNASKNFKFPKYYNSQTMDSKFGKGTYYPGHSAADSDGGIGWECKDIAGPPADRGCAENDLNIDLISNLTKKQQYTLNQIALANSSGRTVQVEDNGEVRLVSTVINRYKSPNSTDLFARIPISIDRQNFNKPIVLRNLNPEYNKRLYFGPVKLRKFKVRLLNDKGFEVNLNNHDWSFSINVTQLYQF